jgi:hypothetical protein
MVERKWQVSVGASVLGGLIPSLVVLDRGIESELIFPHGKEHPNSVLSNDGHLIPDDFLRLLSRLANRRAGLFQYRVNLRWNSSDVFIDGRGLFGFNGFARFPRMNRKLFWNLPLRRRILCPSSIRRLDFCLESNHNGSDTALRKLSGALKCESGF